MGKILCLAALGLFMMGCDASVTDFVKGGGDPLRDVKAPTPVVATPDGVYGIKVSPGRMTAAAVDMSMEMTVTPTNRVISTTDMSMSVTINRGIVAQ